MTFPYASVCVDNTSAKVDRLFDFEIPPELRPVLQKGMRVRVPFGAGNKLIQGIVIAFCETVDIPPEKIKPVAEVLGDYPVFTDETLSLASWMREKYYATLNACLRCILPAGLTDNGIPPKSRKKKDDNAPALKQACANTMPQLTGEQQSAVDAITARMRVNDTTPVLLFGVTGSGKTEVYLRVIAETLNADKQAIVLVPEIALTPQTVGVFKERFGGRVAVTHSRLSAGERFRIWKQALDGGASVMIGPRSAVFTPFRRLGVIIVDEEHEHSYQSETTPKYDARAVALERGRMSGAAVVMGSATPSLESYFRALNAEYLLIKLTERVNRMFPEVTVLDMRRELAGGNTSLFGNAFFNALAETFDAGKQAMLFLNRRGHSSFVSCRWCGYVLKCASCNVNFTYHIENDRLLCHYCGAGEKKPDKCPACGSAFIRYFGVGTQKLEEEATRLFPAVKSLRMDLDTVRRVNGHAKILDAFRQGEAQLLIGTQMIAKGLDFPNVVLVGVVAADMSLYTGDFRAGEHTFQLLTQVSGRAGRAEHNGRVFFQTYNPDHYAIELARRGDYEAFYQREIAVRRSMWYPPYSHVFMVLFAGPDEKDVIKALYKLLAVMRYCNKKGQFDMLGPAPAFVSKIKKQYRWKLLIKCEKEEPLRQFVIYCMNKLRENDPLPGITAHLTLDPAVLE